MCDSHLLRTRYRGHAHVVRKAQRCGWLWSCLYERPLRCPRRLEACSAQTIVGEGSKDALPEAFTVFLCQVPLECNEREFANGHLSGCASFISAVAVPVSAASSAPTDCARVKVRS